MKVTKKTLAWLSVAGFFMVSVAFLVTDVLIQKAIAATFDYREIVTNPPLDYFNFSSCVLTLGEIWVPSAGSRFIPSSVLAYHENKLIGILYEIKRDDLLGTTDWEGLQSFTVSDNLRAPNVRDRVPVDHFDFVNVVHDDGKSFYQFRIFFVKHQEHMSITCGLISQLPPTR